MFRIRELHDAVVVRFIDTVDGVGVVGFWGRRQTENVTNFTAATFTVNVTRATNKTKLE